MERSFDLNSTAAFDRHFERNQGLDRHSEKIIVLDCIDDVQ